MSDEAGDIAAAADRLEAALERIARRSAASATPPAVGDPATREAAARLDALIETLRGALAASPTEQG